MTIRDKAFAIAMVGFNLFATAQSFADVKGSKHKSIGVATALAFDPIPSDALFYSGRPVQGFANLFLGGLGIFLIAGYFADDCETQIQNSDPCVRVGLSLGLLLYVPALLWDGIGGIYYVRKHNTEIERGKKRTFMSDFRPNLAVVPDGAFMGGQFRF